MVVIGITGLIGSGKSEVCNILKREFKIPVIYADILAKHLYLFDPDIKKNVIHLLGDEIVTNQTIDFKKVSKIVFNNEKILRDLEKIIHPAVVSFEQKLLSFFKNKFYFFVALESALLIKSKEVYNCDYVIFVNSEDKNRLTRIKKSYKIRNLYQGQELYNYKWDYVIDNNGTLEELRETVKHVMQHMFESENYACGHQNAT